MVFTSYAQEIDFLRTCDHPNIVKYHASFQHGDRELWIVMEYVNSWTTHHAPKLNSSHDQAKAQPCIQL